MLVNTIGIVLRSVKYSETSLILDIYTLSMGTKTYIINGVRTSKPKISPAILQPLSIVEAVFYDRQDKGINRVKEIKSLIQFKSLPYNVVKSSVGIFILELFSKTIKESEHNEMLFNFLFNTINYIDTTDKNLGFFPIFFMVKLSKYIGFNSSSRADVSFIYFDLKEGSFLKEAPLHIFYLDENLSDFYNQIVLSEDYDALYCGANHQERIQLLDEIVKYYEFHTEKELRLKSLAVLKQIFN